MFHPVSRYISRSNFVFCLVGVNTSVSASNYVRESPFFKMKGNSYFLYKAASNTIQYYALIVL